MEMDIRGLRLPLSEPLMEHARRELGRALGRFARRIRGVQIRVNDINGPRGGADKRCRLQPAFDDGHTLVVEHVHRDAYAAVSQAAARLKRAVQRRLERRQRRPAAI